MDSHPSGDHGGRRVSEFIQPVYWLYKDDDGPLIAFLPPEVLAAQEEETRAKVWAQEAEAELRVLRARDTAKGILAAEKANGSLAFMADAINLKEAFARGIPEATYAVDTLLPEFGNAALVASNKTGKTTMMNHLTKAMVDGIPFLGEYTVEPGLVAFWNYEVGESQWTRWAAEAGIQNADMVHPLHVRGKSISVRSEAVQEQIVEWLRSREIQYWIIDPGHRACIGYNPDDNGEVLEFTEILDTIKERAGVKSIILPLHTGKGGDTARGAARWADWPDATWTYRRDEKAGCRTLSAEGRDVELAESMISFEPTTRSLQIQIGPLTGGQQEVKSIEDEILDFLRNNPDVHPKKGEIGQRLGKSKAGCMDAADRLVYSNRAHYQTGARKAQLLYYGPANLILRAPTPSDLD